MTSDDVRAVVDYQLSNWQPPQVEPGTTVGTPWSAQQYHDEIQILRTALVTPRRQRFTLSETYEQMRAVTQAEATYWVVAATASTLVWFDESTGDFGLGSPPHDAQLPVSFGVRGDLVGVFAAR